MVAPVLLLEGAARGPIVGHNAAVSSDTAELHLIIAARGAIPKGVHVQRHLQLLPIINSSPNPTDSGSPEIDACLTAHNDARAEVGVGPLAWDANVASTAQSWANTLGADNCGFYHGGHDGLGQNLYKSSASASWADATQAWVSEKSLYTYSVFNAPSDSGCSGGWEKCGHYTQVIWKDTQTVGCGSYQCADGSTIVACDYNPSGNFVGQYPY
eukprot:TRINITY_DN688_c0_g2_i5.p1 TRINITY_DN688_c0_g2~~TRINITY_DN688_c0_g2_i5.p1  ORF type:complete len:213 (+),score=9.87 TRINITY_DN688_c0_g2_i5:599-1237(+)